VKLKTTNVKYETVMKHVKPIVTLTFEVDVRNICT